MFKRSKYNDKNVNGNILCIELNDTGFFINFCIYGKDVSASQLPRKNRKHKEIKLVHADTINGRKCKPNLPRE